MQAPSDWETIQLKDVGSSYTGLSGKTGGDFGHGKAHYIPFMDVIRDVRIDGQNLERVHVETEERQNAVQQGDLILNTSSESPDEVALCSYVDFEPQNTYLNSFCFGFRPTGPLNGRYLAYWLRSSYGRRAVAPLAQGSTRYNISRRAFAELSLAIPSPEEQELIVGILADVDAHIANLNGLRAKKTGLLDALRSRLLAIESGTTIRLGDQVTFLRSSSLPRKALDEHSNVAYLHYGDIHGSQQSLLTSCRDSPRVDESKVAGIDRLRTGDIVFTDASEDLEGVAKAVEVGEVECSLVAGLHTIAARPSPGLLVPGFGQHLQHIPSFRSHVVRTSAGTSVYATSKSRLADASFLLPTHEEQQRIVQILDIASQDIVAVYRQIRKTRGVRTAIMDELLSGRARPI